jgi:ATP-dependent Clp protease ATP-binding subunit ClpX
VVALHKLSVTDLMHVLTSPKDSLIRQYETLFSQFDVKLEITEDAIVEIAKIAHTRGTGARGLRSIVERLLAAPNFEAPGGNIAKVTIDGDVVKGLKKPILEEKEDSVEVMLEAEIVRQA